MIDEDYLDKKLANFNYFYLILVGLTNKSSYLQKKEEDLPDKRIGSTTGKEIFSFT